MNAIYFDDPNEQLDATQPADPADVPAGDEQGETTEQVTDEQAA